MSPRQQEGDVMNQRPRRSDSKIFSSQHQSAADRGRGDFRQLIGDGLQTLEEEGRGRSWGRR